jgi:hypothetical protein
MPMLRPAASVAPSSSHRLRSFYPVTLGRDRLQFSWRVQQLGRSRDLTDPVSVLGGPADSWNGPRHGAPRHCVVGPGE